MTSSPIQLLSNTPHNQRRPGLLIGDLERDTTCQLLAQHFAAGRLTADELDARVNAAMAARTNVELHLISADLPHGLSSPTPTVAAQVSSPATATAELLAHGLGLLITLAAIGCTLLLLFATGLASASYAIPTWLAAFGASVSVAGGSYYGRRLLSSRRVQPPVES